MTEFLLGLPLWLLFLILIILFIGSVELGSIVYRKAKAKDSTEPEAPIGALVGGILGLLAFILAFTFSMASSRVDARKHLVLEEANIVGTAYLQAGLLPSPFQNNFRNIIHEYVDLRLDLVKPVSEIITRSEEIHVLLWRETELLFEVEMDAPFRAVFVQTINELIDTHENRKTIALVHKIPNNLWLVLILLAMTSMFAMGYQVGSSGKARIRGTVLLAVAFALVILMIVLMDKPEHYHVNQQPMIDVQKMIKSEVYQ